MELRCFAVSENRCVKILYRFTQPVAKKYTTVEGLMRPVNAEYSSRDGMSDLGLIPSLVKLVGGSPATREARIKKWIRKNGFLTAPGDPSGSTKEDLEEFWREAKALVEAWDLYRLVLDRDTEGLREILGGEGAPREQALAVIRGAIEDHLADMKVTLQPSPYAEVGGAEFMPVLEPKTLLQALYWQILLLLTEPHKMKICANCAKLFHPTRRDRRYCSDECRNTYKSRQWRKRKEMGKGSE